MAKVTVTLRKNHRQIEVSRSEAANMRLLGIALTIEEDRARIRALLSARDKVTWVPRRSGDRGSGSKVGANSFVAATGPLVLQMQR